MIAAAKYSTEIDDNCFRQAGRKPDGVARSHPATLTVGDLQIWNNGLDSGGVGRMGGSAVEVLRVAAKDQLGVSVRSNVADIDHNRVLPGEAGIVHDFRNGCVDTVDS